MKRGGTQQPGKRPKPKGVVGDGGVRDKIAIMEAALKMTLEEATLVQSGSEAPEFVAPVPRFHLDIEASQILSRKKLPTLRQVRCSKRGHTFYRFYNASGRGVEDALQIGDDLIYEYGQWSIARSPRKHRHIGGSWAIW